MRKGKGEHTNTTARPSNSPLRIPPTNRARRLTNRALQPLGRRPNSVIRVIHRARRRLTHIISYMLDRLSHTTGQLVQSLARIPRHAIDGAVDTRSSRIGNGIQTTRRRPDSLIQRARSRVNAFTHDTRLFLRGSNGRLRSRLAWSGMS